METHIEFWQNIPFFCIMIYLPLFIVILLCGFCKVEYKISDEIAENTKMKFIFVRQVCKGEKPSKNILRKRLQSM